MKENLCDGLSIRDQLYSFLVEAVEQRNKAYDKNLKKPRWMISHANAEGQVAALSYAIALMDNPYEVNCEKVLADAEMEATND